MKLQCLRKISALIACLSLLTFVAPVSASDGAQAAQDLSDRIMSPFCPGRTLNACPSDSARQLRDQVGGWFDDGFSEEEVKSKLINIYGEEILGKPPLRGFGMLSIILPAVFLVGGGLLIILKLRARASRDSGPDIDEERVSAIDDEIRKRLI